MKRTTVVLIGMLLPATLACEPNASDVWKMARVARITSTIDLSLQVVDLNPHATSGLRAVPRPSRKRGTIKRSPTGPICAPGYCP